MNTRVLTDPRGRQWSVEIAVTRPDRMRGLRGRAELPSRHALLLQKARSIHTFGMRFPITAVWLDAHFRVLKVTLVPPRRLPIPPFRARHVLECPSDFDLEPGDRFDLLG